MRPADPAPALSIVIPVLDEAAIVRTALEALSAYRARGVEVIVVDGGSSDDTARKVVESGHADLLLCAPRGRGIQINAGAAHARGSILLFLHVDTRLPDNADAKILDALKTRAGWGRFDVRIDGRHWLLPIVATFINLRSRLTGIATGDQAMFVSKALFERAGRFKEPLLMEDIALSSMLRKLAPPHCLHDKVTTSGRRWDRHGALRTILLMWWMRLAYFCGAPSRALAQRYQGSGHEG